MTTGEALAARSWNRSYRLGHGLLATALPALLSLLFLLIAVIFHSAASGLEYAIFVVFGLIAFRTWRVGLYTSAKGVRVVGVFRGRSVSWAQVDKFDLGSTTFLAIAVRVVLRDGKRLSTMTLGAQGSDPENSRPTLQQAADDLNGLLDAARATAASQTA